MKVSRAEIYIQSFSAVDPNGVYLMTLLTHAVLPRWPVIIFCEFIDDSIAETLKEVDDTIVIYRINGLTSTVQWVNKVQDVVPRVFRQGKPRLVIGCGWNVHRIMNYYDVGGDEPLWIIADEECAGIIDTYPGGKKSPQPLSSAHDTPPAMAMSELLSLKTTIQSVGHIVFASAQIRDVFYRALVDNNINNNTNTQHTASLVSTNTDHRFQKQHPQPPATAISEMIARHCNHLVLPRGVTAMDSLEEMATCAIQLDLDIVCSMSPLQCRYTPRYQQQQQQEHSKDNNNNNTSADAATAASSLALAESLSASTLERNLASVDISLNQVNNKSLIVLLLQQSQTLQRDVFNLVSRENTIRQLRQKIIRIVRPILLVDMDNTIVNFSECFDRQFMARHPDTAVIRRNIYTLVDRIAHTPEPQATKQQPSSAASENMDASFVMVNDAGTHSYHHHDTTGANDSNVSSAAVQPQQQTWALPPNKSLGSSMKSPTEWHIQQVREILSSPKFFLNLEPLPGAIATLNELEQMGFQVMFCSMASPNSFTSASEKGEWIMRYFPHKQWNRDLILTGCKHLVQGDILVDDLDVVQNEKKHLAATAIQGASTSTVMGGTSSSSTSSSTLTPLSTTSMLITKPAWNQIIFVQEYNTHRAQQSVAASSAVSTPPRGWSSGHHDASSGMEYDTSLPRIDTWNSVAIQTIINTFFYRLPASVKAACEIRFRNMADVVMQRKQQDNNYSHISANDQSQHHTPYGKTTTMSLGKSDTTPNDLYSQQQDHLGAAARAAITSLAVLPGKTTSVPPPQ